MCVLVPICVWVPFPHLSRSTASSQRERRRRRNSRSLPLLWRRPLPSTAPPPPSRLVLVISHLPFILFEQRHYYLTARRRRTGRCAAGRGGFPGPGSGDGPSGGRPGDRLRPATYLFLSFFRLRLRLPVSERERLFLGRLQTSNGLFVRVAAARRR